MQKIDTFLRRIRHEAGVDVSSRTLRELQHAFLLAVPFENLDIHLGRRIEFTPDAVHRKIVIDPTPRRREEFQPVCDWTQTSPNSIFTQRKLCTLARPNGRALLINSTLTISEDSAVTERQIPDEQWQSCVRDVFGIVFSERQEHKD